MSEKQIPAFPPPIPEVRVYIKALRPDVVFVVDHTMSKGEVREAPEHIARDYVERGWAEYANAPTRMERVAGAIGLGK